MGRREIRLRRRIQLRTGFKACQWIALYKISEPILGSGLTYLVQNTIRRIGSNSNRTILARKRLRDRDITPAEATEGALLNDLREDGPVP